VGNAASVIPGAGVTCNVICLLATSPSPAAVTVIVDDATLTVEDAVSVRVSAFELVLEDVVIGFADQAAIMPLGKPVMLHVIFPVNDPPTAAVRLNLSVPPSETVAELDAEDNVRVGVWATVKA
jgi:hypothetical protein